EDTDDGQGDEGDAEDDDEERTEAEDEGEAIEVLEAGFGVYTAYDDEPRATAGAILQNNSDDTATYVEVTFVREDADGRPVGTESTRVYAIEAGEVGYAGISSVEFDGEIDSVSVAWVYEPDGFSIGS